MAEQIDREHSMTQVSVVAPDGGEAIQLGPIQVRILEDGKTTGHRLGVGEITIPAGNARAAPAPARPARRGLLRGVRHRAVHRGGYLL
jgi:hypothetical protein